MHKSWNSTGFYLRAFALSDVNMFADDAEIHYSHSDFSTVEWRLQVDIQYVSVWLAANKLTLNNIVKSLCTYADWLPSWESVLTCCSSKISFCYIQSI